MKQWIAVIILLCSLLLLSISGYFLADMLMQERKDDALQEQLKEIYEKSGNGETEGLSEEETNDGGRDTGGDSSPVHPGLLALHRENPDCIGWIKIEGTVIDYPVMYRPSEENYYLHRDFNGEYSANGCLFLSELCNPATSDNLIIYGHHMNSGKMFAALEQYKDSAFYLEHPLISYDTLHGSETYQVFAVFCTPVYTGNDFPYYTFTKAEDAAEYREYIKAVKERALYDTRISAVFGDRLLTLSTCEYSQVNGRVVVMAKKNQLVRSRLVDSDTLRHRVAKLDGERNSGMREQEFKARDKTVNKMSRDGLVEENLQKKDSVRISQRELDNLTLPGQASDSVNFQREKAYSIGRRQKDSISSSAENPSKASRQQRQSAKKRRLYEAHTKNPLSEQAGDPLSGLPVQPENHTYFAQEPDGNGDTEPEIPETESARGLSGHSSRMESIRGHPSSGRNYVEAVAETSHSRKKKQVQAQFRKGDGQQAGGEAGSKDSRKNDAHYRETPEDAGKNLETVRENIKKKQKRERLHNEQKKQESRISFDDDESVMVHGAGMGIGRKAASAASHSMSVYAHGKVHEAEQDNSAAEGAHRAEVMAEHSLRNAMRTSRRMVQRRLSRWRESPEGEGVKSRLQFEASQETAESAGKQLAETGQAEKTIRKKFWQKQRIKKSYQAAKRGEKTTAEAAKATQSVFDKIKSKAASVLKNNKGIFGAAAVIGLLFLMLSAGLSSCSAMIEGASSSIIGSTYPSTDEDIYATENAYAALEAGLNRQINNMESTHPGYDEYWYQVDEISHNPYHLISYFNAKYGQFTYEQVKDEVEDIFREQYSLYVDEVNDTVTETKTVRVGESLGQVVTSGYCNCSICCGVWSGGPTASGVYPTANHTIAVDAANPFVPMGTKVVMNGVEYVVEDTGAFARYGVQFDVFYDSHSAASAHGHQTREAFIADDNGNQEVEVTTTEVINRLEVTLTNHNLDAVLRSRMDENEEKRYDLYNGTYGNRNYLFDVGSLPGGGGADGYGYEIPSEALSDGKFARMIHEAEKYLGRPYVWGGASPSTGFDCSGFVSWVINNCGNGWDVGRQTAEGLRGCCAHVPSSQAKPGDLIFFQNTYPTSGASHVGIYVGNNMMIHCGDPIQYTNISSAYWQQHLLGFGRLP